MVLLKLNLTVKKQTMSEEIKQRIREVVNAFEVGSKDTTVGKIYIYKDGPNNIRQITLDWGITEYGNLRKLIELYIQYDGIYADKFKPFVSKIGVKSLVNNNEFLILLIKSCKEDQLMRDAENEVYDIAYWDKAYEWFLDNGFNEPLSLAVIMDSYIHSGGILGFLRNKFNENVPSNGGNEKEWIKQYIYARRKWLAGHSRKVLRGTVYRMDFFLKHLASDNWKFNCPIKAHGVNIC